MTTGDPAFWGSPESGPKLVGGRYELGELLGIGGMAVVRLATDLRLGRTVAVKMLRGELAEAPAFQTRFRREARAAAALDHPAVVSVYDAGEDVVDGMVASYIVMEYVQGQTLRDLVGTGEVGPRRALEITADVLDALATSHRNGIVHRDIKPANVMVTPSGQVKVMDFGVARAVADMSASLTQTSAVIGTAQYLSPEQARGENVDARSDVYSTGCLLYELLTGRPPFQGDSAIAVAYQHVREPAQPPSTFAPGLPAGIDAVVMGALAKHPDERYRSAEQMRAGILAVLDGSAEGLPYGAAAGALSHGVGPDGDASTTQENPAVGADGYGATPAVHDGRRRMLLVAAAVAVVLAVAGAFGLAGLTGDEPKDGQQAEQRTGRRDAPDRKVTQPAETAPSVADEPDTTSGDTGGGPERGAERSTKREADRQPDARDRSQVRRAPQSTPDTTTEPEPETTTEPEPTPEESTPEETASETPPESTEPEPTPPATTTSPAAAAEAP